MRVVFAAIALVLASASFADTGGRIDQPAANRAKTITSGLTVISLLRSAHDLTNGMIRVTTSKAGSKAEALPFLQMQANEAIDALDRAQALLGGFEGVATEPLAIGAAPAVAANQIGRAKANVAAAYREMANFASGLESQPNLDAMHEALLGVRDRVDEAYLAQHALNQAFSVTSPQPVIGGTVKPNNTKPDRSRGK